MVYHPDKNKDSESAADKFREITEAYEVLGNYRLRKLYDKGILYGSDEYQKHQPPSEEKDIDPTTRFYKARMHKESPTATGRTPIYDFDEWTRSHYGNERKRTQKLRQTNYDRSTREEIRLNDKTASVVMFILMFVLIIMTFISKKSKDVNRIEEQKKRNKE